MLSSNFRSFISILAILGLLVQATGAQAALTIVSVTRTGAPTATGALFGNQIDVLVSSPVILSGSIGARVLSGTVAGTSLTTQVSESMSGANFQYLLRSPALTTLATQGSGSVSVSGLGASWSTQTGSRISNLLIDTIAPTLTLSSTTSTGTTLSGAISVRATVSETLAAFTLANITASGGVASALTASWNVYSFTLTPTTNTQPGTLSARVNAWVVMDRIGNLNTASNILNWNYDTRRPTATLTTVSPVATRLAGTGSFTVSFPETITGLTPAKFNSSGGTITSITGAASPYTVVFTPTPLVNSGAISITFPAGSITDAVGLTNTASNTLTWIYDTLPPTLTLAGTGAIALSNQANYALSGSCSENGRTINITLESVNTSALCVAGNWSRTFSTAGAIDGIIPLTITLSDAVGNTTTVSNTVIKDTTIPTVSINPLVAVNQSNSTNYSYSGNCSENSLPVSMRFTDGTTTYAGTGTCTGGTYSGAINLSLLTEWLITLTADLRDSVGNSAIQAVRYTTKDTVAPSLSVTTPISLSIANTASSIWTGTCTESTRSINYILGTLTGSTSCASGTYSLSVDATTLPEGIFIFTGSHTDVAGNTISVVRNILKDTVRPVINLASTTSSGTTLTGSITISLTSSESITGLSASGVSLLGGTLTSTTLSGSNATLVVTPTFGVNNWTLSVLFLSGGVLDWVGNPNIDSNTLTWNYDTLAPTFALSSTTSTGTVLSGSIIAQIIPTETLVWASTGSLSVVWGVVTNWSMSWSSILYTISPTSLVQSGALQINFASGSIMDQAGNPLTTSGALSWNYDTKAPNITGVIFTGSGTTDTGFTAGYSFGTDEPTSSTLVVNSWATQMLIRTGSGTLFANTVFSLTPGITYTYRIISIDSVGNGSVGTGSFIVAHDITPERLGFGTKNTELGGTAILSNTWAVQGISTSIPISITGGQYQINGGVFTTNSGSVRNGDIIGLSVTAGIQVGSVVTATLNLGGVTSTYSVVTISTGAPVPTSSGGGGGGGGNTQNWDVFWPTRAPIIDTKASLGATTVKPDTVIPKVLPCSANTKWIITPNTAGYSGYWAEEAITKAISYGVIRANDARNITGGISREAFAALLLRAFPCNTSRVSTAKWTDVATNSALEWTLRELRGRGWILGDAGNFRPKDRLTRREALEVIARIMGVTGKVTSGKSPFSDLPNSDLSYARFSELKSRGVLAESSVRPRETIQLAELVNYFNIAFWSK